jgi:hypothetical protein
LHHLLTTESEREREEEEEEEEEESTIPTSRWRQCQSQYPSRYGNYLQLPNSKQAATIGSRVDLAARRRC